MKVSTENDNNFGYEKITILVDNIPLSEWAELVPTSLIINAYSVTSGLILIFKMYDLVILFII
jgi:hypothetical protein